MNTNTDTINENNQPTDWLVMYSNTGDANILDDLETAKKESLKTGILDYFVPLDVTRIIVDDKAIERKRLIAGNYIFNKGRHPPAEARPSLRCLPPLPSPCFLAHGVHLYP